MSEVLSAIRTRRSVREYADRPIDSDDVKVLQEALLRAPSSRGIRPCRFVFVRDRSLLASLSDAKPKWAWFIAESAAAVAVCADEKASDAWIEDASVAAASLMLQARELGLGSCWVQIRDRQREDGTSSERYVRDVLELGDVRVECIVALGHPSEERDAVPIEKLRWDAIVEM